MATLNPAPLLLVAAVGCAGSDAPVKLRSGPTLTSTAAADLPVQARSTDEPRLAADELTIPFTAGGGVTGFA